MNRHYDLVILGGGCAGLSLARELANSGSASPRTLVVESRQAYTNDRTWCFWETDHASATHLVSHRWDAMEVADSRATARISCAGSPYAMIPAAAFYEDAARTIAASRRIGLQLGARLEGAPAKLGGLWSVTTTAGLFVAPTVIDTRPQQNAHHADATLWQSFSGVEVCTNSDAFHPECLTLMDFSRTTPGRMLFTYVLPVSARRALIEVTEFSPFPKKAGALEDDLRSALRHYTAGSAHTILRAEAGILPMGQRVQSRSPDPSLVYAGLQAGGARPCTGYAFQRIQRWAADCAIGLCRDGVPMGHPPDAAWLRGMDQLFLEVLRSRPDLAPSMFVSLFTQTDRRAIIRFLSDEARWGDVLGVVASLPAMPFLREVANVFRAKAIRWQESFVS